MPVTFRTAAPNNPMWLISGWCSPYRESPVAESSPKKAEGRVASHTQICEPCRIFGMQVTADQGISPVALAPSHAAHVLRLLGYETEPPQGSCDATELLGRCRRELNWVGIEGEPETVASIRELHLLAHSTIEAGGSTVEWD